MTARRDDADEADAIADLVNCWSRRRLSPEDFHLVRDEIASRCRRLAQRLRRRPIDRPMTTWRPKPQDRS